MNNLLCIIFQLGYLLGIYSVQLQDPLRDVSNSLSYYSNFNVSSLTIQGSDTEDSILRFVNSPTKFIRLSLLAETGNFMIDNGHSSLIEAREGAFKIAATTSRFKNLIFGGDNIIMNTKQWKLIIQEDFWLPPNGWTDNSISYCGGIHMLGGYGKFSGGEIVKTFSGMQEHTVLRIVASYHFIDAWSGESAFLRANVGKDGKMEYIWNEKYDFSKSNNGINVCGADYFEGKFTSLIDLTMPHQKDSITLGFGSTLDQDPYENSFGISNLQFYIR